MPSGKNVTWHLHGFSNVSHMRIALSKTKIVTFFNVKGLKLNRKMMKN